MRKHLQVLLADYQALPLLRSGPNLLVQQWRFRLNHVAVPPAPARRPSHRGSVATYPAPWVLSLPENPARRAKLRLLAPGLRRALRGAAYHSRQHQTRTARERLLEELDSALAQGQALAQYLLVCLSAANALPSRIDWTVV